MAKQQFKAESQRLLDLMINSIYTHREIFLREIISNASDAMDKLAYTALTDENVGLSREDFAVTVTCDKENRTLTVSDNGIGMDRAELEENLGTIARSGSLGFKQTVENAGEVDIIGQFGVGFYSAFMVASSVTVISKKYGEDTAWKWSSEGADGYTVEPAVRAEAGTDVIMVLKPDTEEDDFSEFLEEHRIRGLIRKYSDYIRYPIRMAVTRSRNTAPDGKAPVYEDYTEMQTLNSMVPLWQRAKKDVSGEEYEAFYREMFFDFNKPLRTIHTSAEGSVSFKALLYIPAKAPYDFYTRDFRNGLRLYSSGVMIMESCEDLLPEHFRFVRGVVDSQDLSLNISREMLQHDRQLTIIARNIEKKIRGELKSMLENEREVYEEFYGSFGRQLKYGAVAEYGAHKDAVQDLLLFYSCREGRLISLKEYTDAIADGQQKIYYATGGSRERLSHQPQVETLMKRGWDVLLFTDEEDEFVARTLMTYAEKPFCNASSEDLGLQTEEEKKALEEKAEKLKGFLAFVQESLEDQVGQVRLSENLGSHPAALVPGEGMSFEMEKYMKRMDPGFSREAGRILELNMEHDAVKAMLCAMTAEPEKGRKYARLLLCQAKLMAELPIEDPAAYTELVCSLMN